MREKNDGRGRFGGRQKGTPNKVTATVREWIAKVLDDNRGRFEQDLLSLPPRDRLLVMERLLEYVTPKQARGVVVEPARPETLESRLGVPEGAISKDALVKAATLIQDSIEEYFERTGTGEPGRPQPLI